MPKEESTIKPGKNEDKQPDSTGTTKKAVTLTAEEDHSNKVDSNKMIIIDQKGETLEVGSFKNKVNAFAFCDKLTKLLRLPVMIVYTDLYYSVSVPGFPSRQAAMQEAVKVVQSGFEAPYISNNRRNTSFVQIGEFSNEEEALNRKKAMMERTSRKIVIVYTNNLYKVQVGGFLTHQAAEEFVKELNGLL